MKVSEAIATRKTCRAFQARPVEANLVKKILALAARAPSGGNLQPWRVYALVGPARDELVRRVKERRKEAPMGEKPEYHIYPPELPAGSVGSVAQNNPRIPRHSRQRDGLLRHGDRLRRR